MSADHRRLGRPVRYRLLAWILVWLLLLAACNLAPPSTPSASLATSATPTTGQAGRLTLEECDPAGYVPCEHQAVVLAIPLAGTGLSLTYSSEWAAGRTDRTGWDAGGLGLGGWSINALGRYDAANGVLLDGDGSWRLAQPVALPAGEEAIPSYDGRRAYVFDRAGRHVRTVDAVLGTTLVTFTYDEAGRLSSAQGSLDGRAIRLTVTRSSDGIPLGLVGASGATTSLAVDGDGHLRSVEDPSGRAVLLSSTRTGLVTAYVDAAGGTTTYGFDDTGRLTSLMDPDGISRRYERTDAADQIEVRVSTPLKRVSTYGVEQVAGGVKRTYVAADGTTTAMTTDASGQRTIDLPDGTEIALGAQPDPRWGLGAPLPTPLVEKRPDGVQRLVEIRQTVQTAPGDPLAVTSWSRTTSVDGKDWVETSDPAARSITWTDPAGRRTTQAYDGAGRLLRQTAPGQPAVAFSYDELDRLASETWGAGAAAATTRYAYDAATGLVRITRPDGKVDQLGFDANGRIVRWTAPDGSTLLLARDGAGRLVQVRPPGRPSFTLGNSTAGRPTGFLPPTVGGDGSFETIAQDGDGNTSGIQGPGQRSISVGYDAAGRVSSVRFEAGTIAATYDPASGLLAGLAAPGSVDTTIGYAGRTPASLSWSGPVTGSVTQTLDPQLRITAETVDGADALPYAYDAAGLLSEIGRLSIVRDPASGLPATATLGAISTTWQYDPNARLVRQTTTVNGTVALDRRYERDALGRVSSVSEARLGGRATNRAYGYDDADRLVSVTVDGTIAERYAYDAAGNRRTVVRAGTTLSATYDDRDRLLSWGQARYGYRPDGTLRTRTAGASTTTYDYDDLGALRGVTLADGRRIDYVVDGSGRRIGRGIDGRPVAGYLYRPDGLVAAELDGSGSVVATFGYDGAGHLALMRRAGRDYLVVTDQVGSPLLAVDSSTGEVADALSFDTWGSVQSESAPGFLPFGFAGGLRDPDTGLVHFGARDYDPTTGRWTGPDPIRFAGGDANLYRYGGGDPVNRVDPTGLGDVLIECTTNGCTKTPLPGPGSAGDDSPPPPPPPGFYGGCSSPGFCGFIPPEGPAWYCVGGTCSNGPGGFVCRARSCTGPSGEACEGTARSPCSYGDPHLRTADGRRLDFQAAGEFLVIASPDRSVAVQARQEPFGHLTLVTVNTAVAASVAGDRVAVYADDARPLTIGGKPMTRVDLSVRLPHGGIVERHGSVVTIDWPSGDRLTVTRQGGHLDYGFLPGATDGPALTGLVGSVDGNMANDLTSRSGVVLDPSDPEFFARLYHPFGASWRIAQAESLFDYAPGESTATFTRLDIPSGPATIETFDPATRDRAGALCRAVGVHTEPTLTDCILDVGSTGDPSYAASAAAVEAATGGRAAAVAGAGTASPVTVGGTARGTVAAPGDNARHTFAGRAGQVVYLEARGPCVDGLFWRLIDPDGGPLGYDFACKDLGRRVLPQAGTYTIELYTDGTATGAYAFELLAVPAVPETVIALGDSVSDAIGQVGAWHRYTFTGQAGQVVYLEARGPCVDGLFWRLIDPDGGPLGYDFACKDLGRRLLPQAGTYTIELYPDGTATGAFAFRLRPGT